MRFWSKNILILIVLLLSLSLKCRKPKTTNVVVTVEDAQGAKVEGATVRIYCSSQDCIIDDTQITDNSGQSSHVFEFEAVLAIEATKVIGSDTLFGTGVVELIRGETVSELVIIK